MVNIKEIEQFLCNMSSISRVAVLDSEDILHCISIDLNLPDLNEVLTFSVYFDPWYPAKVCGEESIHFFNKSLIEYPHIMEGGYLCLHTISSPDWKEKLTSDINQLCEWIQTYYIDKKVDEHYEHLVVNERIINDCYYSFNYAQTTTPFMNGEFGYVNYKPLIDGYKKGKVIKNFIAISYHSKRNLNQIPDHISPFSDIYLSTNGCLCAPYIVIDKIPGRYGKFIFTNYLEFENIISQIHRKHILDFSKKTKKIKTSNYLFPLFIGYHIPNGNMAWNVAMIDTKSLPTQGVPEYIENHKTGTWLSFFIDQPIQWVMTNDISPEYFFGRGCYPSDIIEKRILVMGIGAIGSIVAQTLVRGGCKNIGIYDFDIKQPGNVCRSEYDFLCPTNDKMNDLARQLERISPYVNVSMFKERFDEYVKWGSQQNSKIKDSIGKAFKESYDLIIDCTTDDDVMYALEQLNLPIDIVNLSISNHANELVCAFSPSIYEFVRGVFTHSITNDPYDVFYPTGCWNPTFKATYNDINSKLQYTLKKIIDMLSGKIMKQNFIISDHANGLHFQPW